MPCNERMNHAVVPVHPKYQDWTHSQLGVALDNALARVSKLILGKRKAQQEMRRLRRRCDDLQLARRNADNDDVAYTLMTVPQHSYNGSLSSPQPIAIADARKGINMFRMD